MNCELDERLHALEEAHRQLLARSLALETICLALLPTLCSDDFGTARVLAAAEAAFADALKSNGTDQEFTTQAVTWFRRMRADAVLCVDAGMTH